MLKLSKIKDFEAALRSVKMNNYIWIPESIEMLEQLRTKEQRHQSYSNNWEEKVTNQPR